MGNLTDSLFSALMSWVRALVAAIWALFSSERTTALEFLAKNWIGIAVTIIAAGLVIDWLIWLIRWQPYHIWAQRVRRLLRIAPPTGEDEEDAAQDEAARAAYEAFGYMPPRDTGDAEEAQQEQWMPLPRPEIGEDDVQQVMDAAEQVPDEALGQYPGMRYDSSAAQRESLSDTRPFSAVHAEGPGAAEVSRRRAEIDAWQRQMQEEARARAEAERAQRAAEAERARAEREAQAEQERITREAQEAEQARMAQAAYERELEEYERKRAQYERDMEEYTRQMAEYEAALAAQQEEQPGSDRLTEFAQENPQAAPSARRRRKAVSEPAEDEAAYALPDAPQWTQLPPREAQRPVRAAQEEKKQVKRSLLRSGAARMARMIEAESEDVTGIASLPPRVDRKEAYRPAKRPDVK